MGYVIVETLECFVWFSIHGFMSGSFLLFYLFIYLFSCENLKTHFKDRKFPGIISDFSAGLSTVNGF